MQIPFRWQPAALFLAIAVILGRLTVAHAQTPKSSEFPPNIQLPAKARGDDAIAALGSRLPEVAAFYKKTPAQLRQLLREDHSLWADREGRLFYICPGVAVDEAVTGNGVGTTDPSPFPADQTFRLHSRPGSSKVIFLDFDGHDASTTAWGSDAIARPFDTDGNPYSFSASERDRIVYIWQRVAEDYSMYDIDVTTEDPGTAALLKSNSSDTNYGIRAVVGGGWSDWYGSSAGGVAYVGSFDDNTGRPCWIFPKNLGPDSEKYIAEAVSHEVGHTLGLSHDGTSSVGYYPGQGNWAPIMGVGYYEPISQWSKGEYANANNTEDDLTVMLSNGAVYRADDHGNSTGAATALSGVTFTTNGVISQTTDLDFFRFDTGDGPISITVNRAPRDSDLRIQVTLYNAAGTLLQTFNSADNATTGTQPVTLNTTLAAGVYYFAIDGIGNGDPLTTGYSDYASLGQYLISGTLPSDSTWLPTAAGAGYFWTNTANWVSGIRPNGIGATLRLNNNIAGDQTITVAAPVTLGRLFLGDANASHSFTLQSAGGSLQFNNLNGPAVLSKTTGVTDVIAVPLVLQGDLLITNTAGAALTLSGNISGSGALTKAGAGQLILNGVTAHGGGTTVAAGALVIGASGTLSGPVMVGPGATFDVSALAGGWMLQSGQSVAGSGVILGDALAQLNTSLRPGGAGVAGTLTFSNNLTLSNGAALHFDLAATDAPGGGTNDLIEVGGNLTLSGSITVNPAFLATGPATPGVYTLIRYFGTLTGGAANLTTANLNTRYAMSFDDTVPGEIRLIVSGTPTGLVWLGDGTNNLWNLTATNWLDGASPALFRLLDSVTFNDSGSVSPAVNLSGALQAQTVTVNAAANYIFSGSGKISGAAVLTKQGAGTLTLATANDFTGPVTVSAGTLKTANATALGATNANTTVASGATLDLNAFSLGAEAITVSGSGVGSAGAIINSSGTAQNNALRFVTLSGNTTFGGAGRWDIRANPTASLTGNNFALTKTGANAVWLVDLDNTGLGDIFVNQGTLGIQDSTTLGNAANNLTVASGATLSLWNTDVNALNKKLALNGGLLSSDSGDNIITGTVALNSNSTVSVTAGLELQGVLSGSGALTKTGAGTLSLKGANTFTGPVTVSAGTLRAGNAAAFGTTNGGVTIASDARLDIAGFNLGAEPITVTGDGLGNAGAIVNNGSSQQNALRFVALSGNTTFGGIYRWDIRTGTLTGNNRTLTKRGPNEVWLVDVGGTGLGVITIAEGTLGVQGTATLGSSSSNLTVSSGAKLGIWATGASNVLSKATTLSSGTIYNGSGANIFAGNCSMTGSNTFDLTASTSLEMTGIISGSGALWDVTSGTLILSGNNTYSGVTVINGGALQIGSGGATGSPGTGTITNNAALIFNRTNDFTVANVITGTGTLTKFGSGVLTLSGASMFTGNVTNNALNAGVLRLRHNNALGTGPKTINLKSSGSPNSAGTFGIEVENNITLASNLTWNLSNDGLANSPNLPALRSRSGANTIAGNLLLQTGGGGTRIVSDVGSTLNLTGVITTDVAGGRDLYLDGAGSGVFSGTIANGTTSTMFVNVNKEGAGTWTFAGTNNSSGTTVIKAGTFILTGLTGTNSLVVSNGATLRGTGVARGPMTVNGTLAPGTSAAIGTLSANSAVGLNGTTVMRVAKSSVTSSDRLTSAGSVTYGGGLNVTNAGGAFAAGDSFVLFSASGFNNNFASVTLPTLPAGLTWSNRLTLDGSLLVVPVATPVIAGVTLDSGNFNFKFASEFGVNYVLEQAGTLQPPVPWTPVSTNAGTGGILMLSLPVDASGPGRFFRLMAY